MAKKGPREKVLLVCTVCKSQNYVTERNKTNLESKLVLNKFCKKCRKYTSHKESTKFK